MRLATDRLFKQIYSEEMDRVGEQLGVNILFGAKDQNALEWLRTNPALLSAYSSLAEDTINDVHSIISDAFNNPEHLRIDSITDRIKEVSNVTSHRAEVIARTETGRVAAAARRISYQKEDDSDNFLYSHIGPKDHRTTSCCERISRRTSNGVSYNKYVEIMAEESAKDFPEWTVDKLAPQAHYQCRHTFVRIQ